MAVSAIVNIVVSTNLRWTATENQNLRLVRAAQFIQTFTLKVFCTQELQTKLPTSYLPDGISPRF